MEKGWSHGRLPISENVEWEEFAKFWDDLPRDEYVQKSHGTTRHRRIGHLLARGGQDAGVTLERAPHGAFFQSSEINSVYGGQKRTFPPITDAAYDNLVFRAAVESDLHVVRRLEGDRPTWLVTVHMIRILASGDAASAPAPEGRHTDGHDYVIMHLINRRHCLGGLSRVYRKGGDRPALEHTLLEPMETLIVDDRTMEHEVSPIRPADGGVAVRDMMIIDFDRVTPGG
ncbi:hypothetical protein Sme01_56200 [Sphaerisporangium melleum]|uniref:2OG-Fe dioxygenase family protein n=1 Tax=Sphaerisporangium melleum TaxID=321316 RepID=UPI00166666E4|nr:2OG-Fe dioxygenase family protein [Sphaerisporangium melleum]GII73144.1 hypothetical protein Sme01_56200 [Sphaerisporangium melleum]